MSIRSALKTMLSALSAALSVTSVRYLHPMVDTIDAKRRTLPGVAQAFELETISRRISRVKILMDSLNALTLVGAFLAAVQGQVLTLTYTANDTSLQVTTNVLSFVGLTLDIVGTSLGLIESTQLQKHMARLSQLATNVKGMPQIKTEIDSLRSQLQAKGGSATEKRELRSKLADKLELENETMVLFRTYFHHTLALPAAFQITGSLPLNALIGGVLCFLASLLCFIRDTQPNVVFYVTLFMTLVLLGLYFVCAMLAASETNSEGLKSDSAYQSVVELVAELRGDEQVSFE